MLGLAGLFQILSSPHVLTWLTQIRSNCPGPIWPSPDTSARWNWLFLRCAIRYCAAIAVAWLHRDSSRFLQLSLHNKDIWVPCSFKPLNLKKYSQVVCSFCKKGICYWGRLLVPMQYHDFVANFVMLPSDSTVSYCTSTILDHHLYMPQLLERNGSGSFGCIHSIGI